MSITNLVAPFVKGNPGNWANRCGALVYQFTRQTVGWKREPSNIGTAKVAGDGQEPLNKDMAKAPDGAYHFWSVPGVPAGHVAIQVRMGEGGNPVCFMASQINGGDRLSNTLRLCDVQGYTRVTRATYRGWSINYGTGGVPGDWSKVADNPSQDWVPEPPPAPTPAPPAPTPPVPAPPAPRLYTVAKGDTLWDIVERLGLIHPGEGHYDACVRVAAENGIPNPRVIRPGQTIKY
jgi:hypothetical protein